MFIGIVLECCRDLCVFHTVELLSGAAWTYTWDLPWNSRVRADF